MKPIRLILFVVLFFDNTLLAQNAPFKIALEPINITALGGIQSFAFGQHNGKWLIIGGRLDGLHQRQPFAAFDLAGHNNQLIVVDPVTQQKWRKELTTLPKGIQEQLSATNAEFFQEGDYLYIVGGYGYSATIDDHTTFSALTAIKVSSVINAVINNTKITLYFRQIKDDEFAVTGGRLQKVYDTYYLVGGHKFLGRYNPMGANMGPGFIQEYTNQIRKFQLTDDGTALNIKHLPAITDTAELHRRDYNVIPQILPNGEQGLTAFSGVFQYDMNLPFLNSVNIDSIGYAVDTVFRQYYNHYHCANIPLYDASTKEMHNLFFGGIAQFYDSLGMLVQDNDVPFVKTIARVTRDSNGIMTEYKLPIEMPNYLGAGSEFISLKNLPMYDNGILKLDSLINDTVFLGYIYGGISSKAKNIFWINDGTQSYANSQIFKVYLINNGTVADVVNPQSVSSLKLDVYPNPEDSLFTFLFNLEEVSDVKIRITDMNGKIMDERFMEQLPPSYYYYEEKIEGLTYDTVYFLMLETVGEKVMRKIVIAP